MKFIHIPAVDAQGLAPDGSKVAAVADPELLAAIFKAEIGEDANQTSDGGDFAIKVSGETPPKAKPLDAVRAPATAEQRLGASARQGRGRWPPGRRRSHSLAVAACPRHALCVGPH